MKKRFSVIVSAPVFMILIFAVGCGKKGKQITSEVPQQNADAAAPAQRAPIPPGTPTPDVIHKKLNVFVYAANQQAADQQEYDEMDCYNWAESQTSIDPMGPPTPVQQVEKGDNAAKGSRVRGAGRRRDDWSHSG